MTSRQTEYRMRRMYAYPLKRKEASIRSNIHTCMFKKERFSEFIQNVLGIETPQKYKEFLSAKFTEGMSWDNYGEWEIDHIEPLSKASTEQELIKLFHHTNTRPLWKRDNRPKWDGKKPQC